MPGGGGHRRGWQPAGAADTQEQQRESERAAADEKRLALAARLRALAEAGADKTIFDFCALGMRATGPDGTEGPAQKKTAVVTNSKHITAMLEKARCRRLHQHVVLEGGLAKGCEIYPDTFCEAICQGVQRELDDETWLDKVNTVFQETKFVGELHALKERMEKVTVSKKCDLPYEHRKLAVCGNLGEP